MTLKLLAACTVTLTLFRRLCIAKNTVVERGPILYGVFVSVLGSKFNTYTKSISRGFYMQSSNFTSFFPPQRTLMGPGPSDVNPRILEALSRPTIGHLDPLFIGMMDELKQLLRYAFPVSQHKI